MPGSVAEIAARLTLNGSQFSSELSRHFGAVEAAARDTATRTRTSFEASFNQVQQLAQRALALPKGKLDLGVGEARQAAQAAEAQALALRGIAQAAEQAARKAGDLSENTRLYVQAARAAANEAGLTAKNLLAEANALDLLQTELAQTKTATDLVVQGNRLLNQSMDTVVRGAGGSRLAFVQASQQFQDFFIQVGSGQSVITAFAQQSSHLAFVMQGAGGAAGRVAGILSGPWGAAILGGSTLLGLFGGKLFGAAKESENLVEELKEQEAKTRANEVAQAAFARTAEGSAAEVRKMTEALEAQNRTLDDSIARQRQLIDLSRGTNDIKREGLRVQIGGVERALEDARARREELDRKISSGGGGKGGLELYLGQRAQVDAEVRGLQNSLSTLKTQFAEAGQAITAADRALRSVDFPLLERNAKEAIDPIARINRQYDDMATKAKQAASANDALKKSLQGTLIDIEKQRAAALKGESERQSKSSDADLTSFVSPVGRSTTTGVFGEQRPGHRHGGVDLAVPVGTSVQAAAAGTVITSGTLPGYGNVVIIDHGRGTTTRYAHLSKLLVGEGQQVGQGDTIALSGGARDAPGAGNSQGPHLHYEVRRNNRAVDPSAGAFPTDALRVEARAARDLQQEAEQRDRILAQSREQLSIEADGLRFLGLRATGLEEEAAAEAKIAQLRRDSADRLEKLGEAERQAQSLVTDGLDDQIVKLTAQGDAFAQLLLQHGDREKLTDAERQALEAQRAALVDQLKAAEALAKTEADRLRLAEAIARIDAKAGDADQTGRDDARERERALKEAEQQQKEILRDQEREAQRQIDGLADFYEGAFRSGGKSIWRDFKDQGLRVLAQIAAQWTVALLSGQKASLPGILGQIGAQSGAGGGFGGGGFGGGFNPFTLIFGGGRGGPHFGGGAEGNPAGVLSIFGGGSGAGDFYSQFGGLNAFGDLPKTGAPAVSSSAAGGGAQLASIGALLGTIGGTQAAKLFGGKTSNLGGTIGGTAGSAIGFAVGGPIGSIVGSFIGSALGSLVGGLFKKTKKGSATLGFDQYGQIGVTSTRGNSSSRKEAASGAVGSLAGTLEGIAERLGGELGGTPSVSIGVRNKKYVVDTLGQGRTKGSGVQKFASEEEAIRAALEDALRDGVITGISNASKKILASGQDLEKALGKAALIEDIPRRLKALLDPVGSAIDDLNKKWEKTVAALKEGGASSEQIAEAQRLYKLELEQVKASTREASADLKEFLDSLAFGSSSPYSLRDQEAKARASLQPYLDKIAAGETVDQGKYIEASQQFLDIERQLYGSTGKFFESLDLIQSATGKAITTIDNAVPIRTVSDPFHEATASNTATANDLLSQISGQMNALTAALTGAGGGAGDGDSFIGRSSRGFAVAAV